MSKHLRKHLKQVLTTKILFYFQFFHIANTFCSHCFCYLSRTYLLYFSVLFTTSLYRYFNYREKISHCVNSSQFCLILIGFLLLCYSHTHGSKHLRDDLFFFFLLLFHFDLVFLADRMCVTCVLK